MVALDLTNSLPQHRDPFGHGSARIIPSFVLDGEIAAISGTAEDFQDSRNICWLAFMIDMHLRLEMHVSGIRCAHFDLRVRIVWKIADIEVDADPLGSGLFYKLYCPVRISSNAAIVLHAQRDTFLRGIVRTAHQGFDSPTDRLLLAPPLRNVAAEYSNMRCAQLLRHPQPLTHFLYFPRPQFRCGLGHVGVDADRVDRNR